MDCPDTQTCQKFIREKSSGAVIFTCSEPVNSTAGCSISKKMEVCK